MASKRVLLIAGDFAEDYEAMVPFQALQGYGVAVDAVCPGRKAGDFCVTAIQQMAGHQTYSETRGHNFNLNATFDEVEASNYDALVLPGGRAPEYLAQNRRVVELVSEFTTSGKPIATYCHSQVLLAAAGALESRKITAYAPVGPTLMAAGANWVEPESLESFVVDGNISSCVCYLAHAQSIHHIVKSMGGTITGASKRILMLCG
ncbi:Protein DJ-1 D, partial [Stylosanthes scabra]|nr:Protein DJ-1 D [Stylosanthes scabra]